MKKLTLKDLLILLLFVIGVQGFAQTFQENTSYRLRTAIPAQESYNAADTGYPDQYLYPTTSSSSNAVALKPKEVSGTNQLFQFMPITGKTFEYPAASGIFNQVYNVVSDNTIDANGTGVLKRNNLTSNGHRMRLTGDAFPQDNDLNNVIVVSNPVSGGFTESNSVSIIFTAGQPSATTLRRFAATTNFDWLNFGGPSPSSSGTPWIDSWVLETAAGVEVALLSNEIIDTNSIFISNPVEKELVVEGLDRNIQKIEIFDLLGKSVLQVDTEGESFLNISVDNLKSAVYLVKLYGVSSAVTKKIVKR